MQQLHSKLQEIPCSVRQICELRFEIWLSAPAKRKFQLQNGRLMRNHFGMVLPTVHCRHRALCGFSGLVLLLF